LQKSRSIGDAKPFELSALGKEGPFWGFGLSGPASALQFRYKSEGAARKARLLIFQVLTDVIPSGSIARTAVRAKADGVPASAIRRIRQWIHVLLEEGQHDSRAGQWIEGSLIGLIVANVVAVALETIPTIDAGYHGALVVFERLSLVVYLFEYLLRLWSCVEDPRVAARGRIRGRVMFALQPLMVVDFLAFAPSILGVFFGLDLRVLRIFRLFRLLKLARYSQTLQALLTVLFVERSALLASAILLLAFTCLSGELMYLVEGTVQPKALGTMPGAMYWALTTLTTVGYGDISPVTPLGKIIAGVTMIAGLALFSLPVGIIANGFVTGLSRRRFAITWSMLRRQPLFQGFDIEALTEVLEAPTASIIREHTQITVEGRDADEFYLIVDGVARAELANEFWDLGPGDAVGAEALRHLAKYTCTVTAETDLRVMAFHADELRRLCRKYPVLQERVEQIARDVIQSSPDAGLDTLTDDLSEMVKRLQKALAIGAHDTTSRAVHGKT
jgi:voltage-gated potassium channel